MSFIVERGKIGRKPITIVELELDFCDNDFSIAPCTATGEPCYNTFATCKDKPNYVKTTKIYRFCDVKDIPIGLEAFPVINKADLAPAEIVPNGIGKRASITLSFKDFPHHDRGIDPNVALRSYDVTQGTFFGKLKARNPHLYGRKLTVYTGYIGETFDTSLLVDFEKHTYFIESISDVTARGDVRIVAKDVLKFADDDKSAVPLLTEAPLSSDISSIVDALAVCDGCGASLPSSGVIRINDEIMSYSGNSSDILTGLVRGLYNTDASNHSQDDAIQECKVWSDARVIDIIKELLLTFANIDASYINFVDWEVDYSTARSFYKFDAVITESTGVKEILAEVLESSASYLWWDGTAELIRWKPLFNINPAASTVLINDDNILDGSLRIIERDKDRISDAIVFFEQFTPINEVKTSNFQRVIATIDVDSSSVNEYNSKSTQNIKSRWISAGNIALSLSSRLIAQYSQTPKRLTFILDAKDASISTGDIITINSRLLQDATGAIAGGLYLITKREEKDLGSTYIYTALQFNLDSRFGHITSALQADYLASSDADKVQYAFITDSEGLMSNGDEGYVLV